MCSGIKSRANRQLSTDSFNRYRLWSAKSGRGEDSNPEFRGLKPAAPSTTQVATRCTAPPDACRGVALRLKYICCASCVIHPALVLGFSQGVQAGGG